MPAERTIGYTTPMEQPINGPYRHYKGNEYMVLGEATHTETGERLIIYRTLNEPYKVWARPYDMFFETVVVVGKEIPRFTKQGA